MSAVAKEWRAAGLGFDFWDFYFFFVIFCFLCGQYKHLHRKNRSSRAGEPPHENIAIFVDISRKMVGPTA